MVLYHGFSEPTDYRNGIVSIGNFDGVHLGHRKILQVLVQRAREAGCCSLVLTFEPHPIQILRPDALPPRLTPLLEKSRLIHECGVDHVMAYQTDRALLNLAPAEFFDRMIRKELSAQGLVEGPNFQFGKDRSGTVASLERLCRKYGQTLDIVGAAEDGESMISSSSIRAALSLGDIKQASQLLGRPYSICGLVATGAQRGRTIGYPTANLINIETLVPADGVYACRAIVDGRPWKAAVSIGGNPTFGESDKKVEAHLISFDADLYGAEVALEFIARIRGIKKFGSQDELQQQLAEDVQHAANLVRTVHSD